MPHALAIATARRTTAGRIGSRSAGTGPRGAALLLAVGVAAGCAHEPLLERAIRARGGALTSVVRAGDARVRTGFPGVWHWRSVYRVPDLYALSVDTATEPYHYLFDGTTVRAFAGRQAIAVDAGREAPLRSQARFFAAANLDALRLPRYRIAPLAPADLATGAREGLAAVDTETGATYRLGFDRRGVLVWLTGPLDLAPLGRGEVTARFDDFRHVGGLLMPFRTAYGFGDTPLVEEQASAVCPNVEVTREALRDPGALPGCGAAWIAAGP